MVPPTATPPLALIFATAAVLLTGCFDTSSTITTADYPTRLTVDPLMFRGSLYCGAAGLERYVATLYDVSVAPVVAVTTSGPVDCQNFVSFGEPLIVSTHFYTAAIDGYDRDVETDPSGEVLEGGRPKMRDPSSKEPISPKWATTCGEVPPPTPAADAEVLEDAAPYNPLRYPTQALGKSEVIVHGCLPLAGAITPDGPTGDGSSGGNDGSTDAQEPADASAETSDGAEPDGGSPGDDGASDVEPGEGGRRP
jgi:hypothetical protein